jgi:hypothetical protein
MTDKCVFYKKGYKYPLTRPFRVKLDVKPVTPIDFPFLKIDADGNTTAMPGYAWNGASGPTIDTKDSIRGSLIHDIGYQLIRLGVVDCKYKEYFDRLLKDICIEDGMNKWRAKLWQWAVLKFGRGSTRPSAEPREEVAP